MLMSLDLLRNIGGNKRDLYCEWCTLKYKGIFAEQIKINSMGSNPNVNLPYFPFGKLLANKSCSNRSSAHLILLQHSIHFQAYLKGSSKPYRKKFRVQLPL